MQEFELMGSLVASALTSLATFFFTRKKYKSEVSANEIENVQEAIKIWKDIAIDLKLELESTKKELQDTKKELQAVKDELITIRIRNAKKDGQTESDHVHYRNGNHCSAAPEGEQDPGPCKI